MPPRSDGRSLPPRPPTRAGARLATAEEVKGDAVVSRRAADAGEGRWIAFRAVDPLPADSPLYRLPNVFLTPHIAGSLGNELARLGGTVVTELERLTTGLPPAHPVHRAELAISA